jgi:hypothetical protein
MVESIVVTIPASTCPALMAEVVNAAVKCEPIKLDGAEGIIGTFNVSDFHYIYSGITARLIPLEVG